MPHTPGPWIVDVDGDGYHAGHIARVSSSAGGCRIEVWSEKWCEGEGTTDVQANAKLMAAAPDLLAACQFMMQKIHEVRAEMRAAGQVTTNQDEAEVAMIQAAIDKATK